MPRQGERRPSFTLRLSTAGREHLEKTAIEHGLVKSDGTANLSELIRRYVAYADGNIPESWLKAKH